MAKKDVFETCVKPPWQPPAIAFQIVWPILYTLYAITLFLEWDIPVSRNYLLLGLVLNLCWVPLFAFNTRLALFLLTLMIAVAGKCVLLVRRSSMYVFLPYLAWISFAWTLNAYIAVSCP